MDELNLDFLEKIEINPFEFVDNNDKIASIKKFDISENIDISNFDIALLGINDNTNTSNLLRKELYNLYLPLNSKIIDLGNIKATNNQNENLDNLYKVLCYLNNKHIKLILFGANELYNISFFKNFEKNKLEYNGLIVDSKIDFNPTLHISPDSYLNYFAQTNKPFSNFHIIGIQNYLTNYKYLKILKELGFIAKRLSQVTNKINEVEPIFRTSHFVSIDIASVKASDAPGCKKTSPNGFTANEICQLGFYSGLSENIQFFTLNGIEPNIDVNNTTSKLSAQIIWHFIEAYYIKKEVESNSDQNIREYYVKLLPKNKNEIEIKFSNCINTNRWWFSVINMQNLNNLACTQTDYELAKKNIISERIIKCINT